MAETKYFGIVWAWQEGDGWVYQLTPDAAPEGASPCEMFELDGEMILHHSTTHTGVFIRAQARRIAGTEDSRHPPALAVGRD
jgi:hypothetical protein